MVQPPLVRQAQVAVRGAERVEEPTDSTVYEAETAETGRPRPQSSQRTSAGSFVTNGPAASSASRRLASARLAHARPCALSISYAAVISPMWLNA
jgi:hypothetical protein